mmetsp:Transcript_38736/g.109834  ORF Transcript_38736/g.109834 Transcript_38736/m.109834 type:complete len:633 (+) Transcript_38736:61-1959(+)
MAVCIGGGGESRDQDLLSVAAEIQRMLEAGGYKPLPVTAIGKSLSMQSHLILLQNAMGLIGVIQSHHKFFKVTEIDGCHMVSMNGVPWLGPKLPPSGGQSSTEAKCAPDLGACGDPSAASGRGGNAVLQGLPRGKALEMMGELAEMPALQNTLQEIARLLFVAPKKTLLVSEVGSQISQSTRSFLRSVKLRVAQLLQCFPNDFALSGQGPATAATYRHTDLKQKFAPQPSAMELNSGRYYRLLKLGADITERFEKARAITAREVQTTRSSILFVDCRSDAERAVSVIPNSVPAASVLDAALAEPQLVVAYCCVGAHSADWCEAQADGIWAYKMRFLAGGMAAWAHHAGNLVEPLKWSPTTRVHCWVRELAPFFPVASSGFEVVLTEAPTPPPGDVFSRPSDMRHMRLRNLAWEVRLRYWPSVFCIEAADLQTQLASGSGNSYLVVDCRTPEERQVSTVAARGAVVISADELRMRALDYINAYSTIVTFCTIGGRSGIFCKKLVEELVEVGGYQDEGQADMLRRKVVNMLGGIASWLHTGGGLVDVQGQRTSLLHPWCQAFLDMFPLEGLELVFDECRPVPQDALSLIACKQACGDKQEAFPQRLLQMCSMLPPEVINDSLTRAMESCAGYED